MSKNGFSQFIWEEQGGGSGLTAEEGVVEFNSILPPATAISFALPTRGTAIVLPSSAAAFNNNPNYAVFFNGVEQEKGQKVLWVSPTQVSLVKTAYAGNCLTIRKYT